MNLFNLALKSSFVTIAAPVAMVAVSTLMVNVSHAAEVSEASVQNYAVKLKQAANSKNINAVSNLVADDAIIQLSRGGRVSNLNKSAYLKLLQESWAQAVDYRYDITISNIVTSGDRAFVSVQTVETWTKSGVKTTRNISSSRTTLRADENNLELLKLVAEVNVQ